MKLAPIADKITAAMRKREEPDDDYLAENPRGGSLGFWRGA